MRETKRAVRDSKSGVEKLAVGRHIGDRGHVITKQKNTNTGDLEENHDYTNLDEGEIVWGQGGGTVSVAGQRCTRRFASVCKLSQVKKLNVSGAKLKNSSPIQSF